MDAAGRGVGEGVGNATAVADDVKSGIAGFQLLVDLHFHIVELDLHTVKEGVVVGGAGGDFIQSVNHFNNAVQDPLGQHQRKVAGGGVEGGDDKGLVHTAFGGAAAPDQIAEPLDDDTAAQHIAQAGDGLAVAVGVFEGLGEMLGHQKGKVGVAGLEGGVLIAVAVDGDDAVGILVYHRALGIHAEGTDLVTILLGAVDDLAFVQFIRQVGKHRRRQLHPHADIHTAGLGGDLQFLTDLLHPLAAASAHRDDAFFTFVSAVFGAYLIATLQNLNRFHRGIKEELHLILQVGVDIFQHHIVDIGTQMPHGSVQQMQIMLDAHRLKPGAGGGVKLGAFAAEFHIDVVHIMHQLQGLLLADVLIQCAAKIVGDVVLAIRKSAGTAEAAHNGAAFAADTGFDLISVNGTAALMQGMTGLKNRHLHFRFFLHQLIGGKDTAWTCADNNYIIIFTHNNSTSLSVFSEI